MSRLEQLVKELPPQLHPRAERLIEELIADQKAVEEALDLLEGCLADDYPGLSSVDLQHLATKWIGDSAADGLEHTP
jgi:hypothetical protein